MAKRKTATTALVRGGGMAPQVINVRVPSARKATRRAPTTMVVARSAKRGIRHIRKSLSKQQPLGRVLGGIAIASGLIGLAEKSGVLDNLPVVPLIGKKGVVALGAWALAHWGGGGPLARDVAIAATALSTYQLGKENKITGDY